MEKEERNPSPPSSLPRGTKARILELFRRTLVWGEQFNALVEFVKTIARDQHTLVDQLNVALANMNSGIRDLNQKLNRIVLAQQALDQQVAEHRKNTALEFSGFISDIQALYKNLSRVREEFRLMPIWDFHFGAPVVIDVVFLAGVHTLMTNEEYVRAYNESFNGRHAVRHDGSIDGDVEVEYFNFSGQPPKGMSDLYRDAS